MLTGRELLFKILKSARTHGENADVDSEVGDLEDALCEAIDLLEKHGKLPEYTTALAETLGQDQIDFDWLLEENL